MASALILLIVYLMFLLPIAWGVGQWLTTIAIGRFHSFLFPMIYIEKQFYRLMGIHSEQEMTWKIYAQSVLIFNVLGVIAVYILQRLQPELPLNPQAFPSVSEDSAFNTAISFVTNTNWQGYSGENTMSYLVQMIALTVQNFLSAATGIAVAFAFIRGLIGHCTTNLGNFWVDVTRITLYLLLPLSIVFAIFLMNEGVIQNFLPYQTITVLDPPAMTQETQTLPMGTVASQEAIKLLGTNGGGFFNANSAHPFENPTPLSNFFEMLVILIIPAGLCFTFGNLVGNQRQGIAILTTMTTLFVLMGLVVFYSEHQTHPLFQNIEGHWEGKETRFGINMSALFATITTATSCGAVNAMHDSFMPLGGLALLWLIQLGEIVFGGVGSGLYGMLIFALLAVFIAGLMVGRTPEYLGKKIERFEMKIIALIILITPFLVLGGTALAISLNVGTSSISNPNAHGFSQILYAFSSAANNNGSAFAGLNANTPFYNISLAIVMWLGRFITIVGILAIAGSLAVKKRLPITSGTLPTDNYLFVILLLSTIVLVGALTYLPVLVLAPITEYLQLFVV
jgi:potassium-transporting ATPase potassium-binding subunit